MKKDIAALQAIATKPTRRIIGLMSGTSLDGLDVALCACTGAGAGTQVTVQHFKTVPYTPEFKAGIQAVFAKQTIDFQQFTILNVQIAETHAAMVLHCLADWGIEPKDVDLIASHGQTVFHAPRVLHGRPEWPNATMQIGDGDHIARRTGIITISDFRQKHVAAGGEGAPLALYGDYYLFSKAGEDRVLLNIGGIANFTYLPGNQDTAAAFATDTGPGNTLLDAFARELFEVAYDRDALLASKGRVLDSLLDLLKADPFFSKPFPKTTGPELFSTNWVRAALDQMPKGFNNPYDIMATLTRLTAETIAEAIQQLPAPKDGASIYLSGGGAHNPLIRSHLQVLLPNWPIQNMQALGIDGDAKEAVLFAVLANENVAGADPGNARLGGIPLVSMGKISLP